MGRDGMYLIHSILASPLTWIVFAFGICIGSFLNVCIYRIPAGSFFKYSRSVCRSCGSIIPWVYNVPIFSFFLLRGRSACCRQKISWGYPIVESLTGLIFVVLYWKFPFVDFSFGGIGIDQFALIRFFHAAVFCSVLIICSVIDLHHMIIPDVLSLPMILLTPVVVAVHPDLDWFSASIGVILGGGALYAVAWIYWIIRRDYGLGMGDVKLLAGIGGWLGYQSIFPTILIASISGSIVGITILILLKRASFKAQIPFGPFLSIGAMGYLILGGKVLEFIAGGR